MDGRTCYVGVYEDVPLSWVYLLLGNSRTWHHFLRKIEKQGKIFLGNRPNCFVKDVSESQS